MSSLDFGNQAKVMRRIRTLAASGLGVLFTTHDPNQALRDADRVALLGEGRVLAQGVAREVLSETALAGLYGAGVRLETGEDGDMAFLPELFGHSDRSRRL